MAPNGTTNGSKFDGVIVDQDKRFWRDGICIYQIYPASFKDSNGDGYGDIPGIISKLDYLKSLGVDAIWICPHHKSPRIDEGYDISDYQDVHEPFGTVKDCEELIEKAHAIGLKVLFDLVINHCSDEHPWFVEARSSKDHPKRDWFHWHPGKVVDGKRVPPNNWRSNFGGSCWEWDEKTQEYFLHYFCPEQPDWNWENPETRKALYDNAILFWLERGLDGFRIDTVNMYSKHTDWPDAPVVAKDTPWQPAGKFFCNGPNLHKYLREMYDATFAHFDTFTLGELPNTPELDMVLSYISRDARQLDSTILFDIAELDHKNSRYPLMPVKWELKDFKRLTAWAQQIAEPKNNAMCLTYLENHDQARCVTRYGNESPEHRVTSAKMLATYLLTMSGSCVIYEGQEIGMINAPKDWDIEKEYIDVNTINTWKEIKEDAERSGDKSLLAEGKRGIQLTARDHSRTPMQWDQSTSAGFSTNPKTWYRVMESYKEGINVAAQDGKPDSVLTFYRELLKLRKEHANTFTKGIFSLHDPENNDTMVYTKTGVDGKGAALVVLSFSNKSKSFTRPSSLKGDGKLLFSTVKGVDAGKDELAPYEARVYTYA